jgi:hypothetical protein
MLNPVRKLIREAFNEAAQNFKKERSRFTKNPENKEVADKVLNQIITRPDLALKYKWSPQGAPNLSPSQQNYVINQLFGLYHNTGDEKYKKIISYMYSPFSENGKQPPLYNILLNKLKYTTTLERLLEKNPDIFEEFLTKSWGRIFAGGTIVPDKGPLAGQRVDFFNRIMSDYSPDLDFEARLIAYLYSDLLNLIRKEDRKASTVSIDKPTSSGKSHDFGGMDDDTGSDAATSDEYGETIGSELSDTGPEKQAIKYSNPALKMEKFKKAISEIVNTARAEGIGGEAALTTLSEIALNGLNYNEILDKYKGKFAEFETRKPSDLLRDLIFKNKKFQELSNAILNQYDLPSLMDTNIQWISKGEKELAATQQHANTGGGEENDSDESNYTFEALMNEHMNKAMGRVYKRIQNLQG